jgi:hypothetical protein
MRSDSRGVSVAFLLRLFFILVPDLTSQVLLHESNKGACGP